MKTVTSTTLPKARRPVAQTQHPDSEDLLFRDGNTPGVLVLDGYGLSLAVSRAHLILRDGLGRHRRERRLTRAQRTVTRIVILGHTGNITLEAVRWCRDTGVALLQYEPDGTLLLTASFDQGRDDARLRRSQAAAAGTTTGVEITRKLLAAKLGGQAANLERHEIAPSAAASIRDHLERLGSAKDLAALSDLESQASNAYFGAWSGRVTLRFAERDTDSFPVHWRTFVARGSVLHRGGRSPRSAADPINALLNYVYALAEAECQLALRALGLDPGLGLMHTDKPSRDSLALDLLEAVRPAMEDRVLQLLAVRHFTRTDLVETPQGQCRLLPPLTHELAAYLPYIARQIAPHAEAIAHGFAKASPAPIEMRTPLTRGNRRSAQVRGARSANRVAAAAPKAMPTCRTCGVELVDSSRQLCPTCWPVTRRKLAESQIKAASAALATQRAAGNDPSNTPEVRARRAESLRRRKAEETAYVPTAEEAGWDENWYRTNVLPSLGDSTKRQISASRASATAPPTASGPASSSRTVGTGQSSMRWSCPRDSARS